MKSFVFFLLCALSLNALPDKIVIVSNAETSDNQTLNTTGDERARAFQYYFTSALRWSPPSAIFCARETTPSQLIFLQTASYTSLHEAIPIHAGFSIQNPNALVEELNNNSFYNNKTVLIIWDSSAIPTLIQTFGRPSSPCTSAIAPCVFLIDNDPTTSQVFAQQLLFGDGPSP